MAGLEDILGALPIDQIAAKLGVDPATAQAAVAQGGGAILSGLQRNAQTPEGSSAIEAALGRHTGGTVGSVDEVDTADGGKILGHIFGGKEQEVAQNLTQDTQTAGIDFSKLLPILAPVVMGMLAKNQAAAPAGQEAAQGAGGIGDLIGGLLGGGGGQGGGLDIGGLLGGLLGGNK